MAKSNIQKEEIHIEPEELKPELWKYIHPRCAQISFYTDDRSEIPEDFCKFCSHPFDEIDPGSFILCSPEEAERILSEI